MKLKITLFIAILACSSVLKAQDTQPKPEQFKNRLDSVSYAIGFSVANDLKARGVTTLNLSQLVRGMQEAFTGIAPALNAEQCQMVITATLTELQKKALEPVIAASKRFLEENKKKKGVITTASGLQYEILQNAAGAKPKATDQVTVHYRGTLTDGKQFDSSYDRNEPTTFALNQVIPGWTEGLQLMSVGSKYRFYIPYQLAYGDRGAGADIPPYSTLIFEVELIKIGQ